MNSLTSAAGGRLFAGSSGVLASLTTRAASRHIRPIALSTALSCALLAPVGAQAADSSHRIRSSGLPGDMISRAVEALGVSYKWGGNTPQEGLDCSGLVRHVFSDAIGRILPRRSIDLSREGKKVDRTSLQPGDLVFFDTLRRAYSHVGIYIGDNRFVHAPSRGKQVRVDSIDQQYWAQRFNGARRLLPAETTTMAAAATPAPAPLTKDTAESDMLHATRFAASRSRTGGRMNTVLSQATTQPAALDYYMY